MAKSVFKNYLYYVAYQLITIILPLITIPYVSRVLGADGIGINAFTSSNITYFVLLGSLGLDLYGNREVAYNRENKENLSKTFWEIFILKASLSFIAFIVFIVLFGLHGQYKNIYLIQSINILVAVTDISWLLAGLEEFKKTVTRNLIVKIIGIILIFLFIKKSTDIGLYIFISSITALIGQMVMWVYLPSIILSPKKFALNIKQHFMPALKLFVPQIAIQIYIVLDKTMLGTLSNMHEVAYYDQSQKIIKLIMPIITSLGTVMLPRMANAYAKGETEKLKDYLTNSFKVASALAFPIMLGVIGVSGILVPWFFGNAFLKVSDILVLISPTILFISWSNVLGMQYLVPLGKNREFTYSVTLGAIVNFVLNILLIPHYGAGGASFSSVIAELTVTFVQILLIRKYFNLKQIFINIWKYAAASFVMFLALHFTASMLSANIISTIIQVVIGGLSYGILLIILKDQLVFSIFSTIRNKLKPQVN